MTDLTHRLQFFLGANAAEGFASLYDQWFDQATAQAFYVIKGGAGCGKSTLMGQVARHLEDEGYSIEYIRCSGDPDSLDGIYIPQKETAMVDGTAPHRIDPAYPGATGHYVDLGAGYDRRALLPLRQEIIQTTQAYQTCYPAAYRCFQAAEESLRRGQTPLHTKQAAEKTEKRAAGLLDRERKTRLNKKGIRALRFLGGATCHGSLFLEDTVRLLCDHGYQIQDTCGLAGLLLRRLEEGFLAYGYDVIACPDPRNPSRLAHLLVPERKLAFVTGEDAGFRTIRTESLVDKDTMQQGKSFLRLSSRVARELMKEGMDHLAQAKALHDQLEEQYHPYVDFSLADEMAERITAEILSLPDKKP